MSDSAPEAVEELPKFDDPPVTEVVIGVEFVPLPELTTVRLVQTHALWADRYPRVVEQPALPPTTRPDGVLAGVGLRFGTGVEPLRLWMLSEDEHHLLQLQNDRLTLNWRRLGHVSAHPSYADLLPEFEARFQALRDYLSEIGGVQPTVAEVTYVNTIDSGRQPGDLSEICSVVSEFPGPGRVIRTSAQFVAEMEDMPGHTVVTFTPGEPPGTTIMTLVSQVALRANRDVSASDVRAALNYAHRCSVLSFSNLTRPALHERWRRSS